MTIDVWMQRPTLRFLAHDMFASLRRWTGQEAPTEEIPLEASARLPQELAAFMNTRTGRRKVLFGTNYPMISHTAALADLDALGLDDEARRLYLHDNAARIFGLEALPPALAAC